MCEQMNSEEYEQDPPTQIETMNTEKQEHPNQIEKQNIDNRNTIDSTTTKQT